MSIIAVFAALALAGLLVWKIGAPIARFGGALMVVSSLAFIVMGDPIAVRAPWLVIGAVIWLAGHFLFAYQRRFWRSRLAENVVVHTPLRYIDPVGGAEYREARRENRAARIERPAREAKAPAKAAGPSRGVVYGKRAAKAAGNLASRTVPGARVARSAWRFIR
uniref:Integral membrane protein n=1 Tax=Rhodococcus hoagii TaxID=43767 RepID=A0A1Z1UWR7_RHOHA|nr:hypothetical protein [Prescottella equi]ARX59773.1 putative integral membrane protein [Prescottella equi]ARX59920.1 putative integral membrane protein [Prescottella equi]